MPAMETSLPASLAIDFCGLRLASPIVLLSGCVGFGEEYTRVEGFSNRDAGAIVHLHSTHSVAVSMLPDVDAANAIPPMTAYYVMRVGRTALVPYYRPGDPAVADAIRGLAGRYTSVLLANHGPVVAGKDLEAAVYATEELEETAKLRLLLHGLNPRLLTREQVRDLVTHFGLDSSIAPTQP